MKKIFATLALSVSLCASAFGATESHLKTAQELLTVSRAEANIDYMTNEMMNALMTQSPNQSPELKEALTKWYKDTTSSPEYKQLLKDFAEIYTRHFTEAEMKELIGFYKTPTGQKALNSFQPIARETMQRSQTFFMQNQAALQALIMKQVQQQKPQQQPTAK